MRYVAAYALAVLAGNPEPSNRDLEKIIGSVGIDADAEKTNAVIAALKGTNLEALMAERKTKLASMPGGGSVPATAGTNTAAPTNVSVPPAARKDQPAKEDSEEEGDGMGFGGLFD